MRLTSWQEKDEITGLQTCVQNMITKKIKLVNVIQVMLIRRILPCQRQTCYLWEFDPAKHQTLQQFFGTTHEDIWKVLFKANEMWPKTNEDGGHDLAHLASSVSFPLFQGVFLTCLSRRVSELPHLFFMVGRRRRSGFGVRLRCPRIQPSHV